jgi:hypothetical protein
MKIEAFTRIFGVFPEMKFGKFRIRATFTIFEKDAERGTQRKR